MTPEVSLLIERWSDAGDVLDLDLVQATADLMNSSDDPNVQDQCGELLTGVYHYQYTPEEAKKIEKMLR